MFFYLQKKMYLCQNFKSTAMKDVTLNGMTFTPYITREQIDSRINELGKIITDDYKGRRPVFLCVLNGAFPFASDLFRRFDGDAEIEFIRLKSYEGTQTAGVVKEVLGLSHSIEGRDVIVVEDIVDTGHTIAKLLTDLKEKNPASLKVATLLFKPEALVREVHPDYVGFPIPKKFIIGFGLDLDGLARNLNDIYILKED